MTKKQKKVLWRIIATAVLVAVVKLFSIGGVAGTVLYLAAYLIIGYDILRKAFRGIIKGQVFDENLSLIHISLSLQDLLHLGWKQTVLIPDAGIVDVNA